MPSLNGLVRERQAENGSRRIPWLRERNETVLQFAADGERPHAVEIAVCNENCSINLRAKVVDVPDARWTFGRARERDIGRVYGDGHVAHVAYRFIKGSPHPHVRVALDGQLLARSLSGTNTGPEAAGTDLESPRLPFVSAGAVAFLLCHRRTSPRILVVVALSNHRSAPQ